MVLQHEDGTLWLSGSECPCWLLGAAHLACALGAGLIIQREHLPVGHLPSLVVAVCRGRSSGHECQGHNRSLCWSEEAAGGSKSHLPWHTGQQAPSGWKGYVQLMGQSTGEQATEPSCRTWKTLREALRIVCAPHSVQGIFRSQVGRCEGAGREA